jgi:hypothetical protein
MKLYHTSTAPIYWANKKLDFKKSDSPSFLGLHAWDNYSIAKQRTTYSSNDFLYEFEYPIDSIEELMTVDRSVLNIEKEKPSEIAVKLEEDGGAGVNKYHAVIIDYSLISNWRELYANKGSKYLAADFNEESIVRESSDNIQSNQLEENSKIKEYAKWFFLGVALVCGLIFDGYIQW